MIHTGHGRRLGALGCCLALAWLIPNDAHGQGSENVLTLDALSRMSPAQLDALYANAAPGPIPTGKARGRALLRPGTRLGPAISKGAGVVWQGKVFGEDGTSAVNRFFGVKAVRAEVSCGPSWRDGGPSMILDYAKTSRIYAKYRDELRQVAPGLWLGLMYDRTQQPATLKMYFAIQTQAGM